MTVTQPAAAPRLSWSEFLEGFDWRQGEHLTLIGPTQSGKTTLARELARRDHVPYWAAFAPKARDPIIDTLRADGFVRIPDWSVSDPRVMPKVVLSPPLRDGVDSLGHQREVFKRALRSVYRQGGWRLWLDELRHVTDFLGLERDTELLYHQGASLGVSVMGLAQRPRHVPLVAYDQATHLFMFHNGDSDMRKRLSAIAGKVDAGLVADTVSDLADHEVAYVNPHRGTLLRTRVELR